MKRSANKARLPGAGITVYIIGGLLSLIFAGLVLVDPLVDFERKTVDWRMQAFPVPVSPEIVLVGISEEDIARIGPLPWSRAVHAQAIEKLAAAKPAVIGYSVGFVGTKNKAENDRLVAATRAAGNVVFPVYAQNVIEEAGVLTGADFIVPFPELVTVAAALGHNTFLGDPDTVVRRVAPALLSPAGALDSLSLAVFKSYKHIRAETVPAKTVVGYGEQVIPVDEKGLMTLMFTDQDAGFTSIPFHRLLAGEVESDLLTGKIVLVGAASPGTGYFYNAPGGGKMSELAFHGNAVNTLLAGRFFREVGDFPAFFTVFLLGMIATGVFSRLSPGRSLFALLAIWSVYLGLVFFACFQANLFLDITLPLLTVLVVYGASVIYGYVLERREKKKITRTFGRYVAPQVVEEILKYGEFTAVKSKKQVVTVLFVDLSGFTPLSESLPPEQLVTVLNSYLELVIKIIFKYEGTIDKFIGDAVMVIFNAPLPVERHELKAVAAALEIQTELVALSREIERKYGRGVKASIGINTGEVILGNIGALNRVEYAAIGDNVNIAARLQAMASGGQIIISAATCRAVEDAVVVAPLGYRQVKGKAEALEVFAVTARR